MNKKKIEIYKYIFIRAGRQVLSEEKRGPCENLGLSLLRRNKKYSFLYTLKGQNKYLFMYTNVSL